MPAARRKRIKQALIALCAAAAVTALWCGAKFFNSYYRPGVSGPGTLTVCASGKISTMDPALADEYVSGMLTLAVFDTLLQYDYTADRPRLAPSALEREPELSPDRKTLSFTLREGLFFTPSPCFGNNTPEARKVRASDVVFSFLRLADARVRSPGNWLFRGKIKGFDKFREKTSAAARGDFSVCDSGCEGLKVTGERTFTVSLEKPDPNFLWLLAMPYTAIVSRRAAEYYGDAFQDNPTGSGPFRLVTWRKDYKIELARNPEYDKTPANSSSGSAKPVSGVVCYLVKQPFASWLMFLQGNLDISSLDKDNFESVTGPDGKLSSSLAERGIKLFTQTDFQTNFIGFNFLDTVVGGNAELRKALAGAFDQDLRVRHASHGLIPANGPLPPGCPGYDASYRNPFPLDLKKAAERLEKAGYKDGIDPKTGKALELTFDLAGNSSLHRQIAELMMADMKKIGVIIKPALNSRPRFFQKLAGGQTQLFRLSWVGDYPDDLNFLQLFYSKNAGGCNRASYRDDVFDKLFEAAEISADPAEKNKLTRAMLDRLAETCPWIYESWPVANTVTHSWVKNYRPNDFVMCKWKYLLIDEAERTAARKKFTPLSFENMRQRTGTNNEQTNTEQGITK